MIRPKLLTLISLAMLLSACNADHSPLNVLLITADDLGIESPGCFGGKVEGLTPNIDHFASQGVCFTHAHVNAAICMPSRIVLGTGLYGHNSGAMGFIPAADTVTTLMDLFQNAGYKTGILGKIGHSTPHTRVHWNYAFDREDLGDGRSPELYYQRSKAFFEFCKKEGKPFYFMVNSHDPHRPFQVPGKLSPGAEHPSTYFTPEEAYVPGYLPNLPELRVQMSYYQNSVKRFDDTFGKVLLALEESGLENNTLVMFLSDNGIAIPFAKCNTYLSSTNTPWIVRWPGVTQAGSIDSVHFISGIDFMPTVLDATGIDYQGKQDGFSFVPILKSHTQKDREDVFTQLDRRSGDQALPMRCIQNKKFGYIFNGWSDGEYRYRNGSEAFTMNVLNKAAKYDSTIAERVRMYRYRTLEELYDLEDDPNCLHNLIDNPEYEEIQEEMTRRLNSKMKESNDPLLKAFQERYNESARKELLKNVYGDDFDPSR